MDEEQRDLEIQLEMQGSTIMRGINQVAPKWSRHGKFGTCSTCTHLQFAETEFRMVFIRCGCFGMTLDTSEPIMKCSEYYCRSQFSLYEMMDIATLINAKGRKVITSFSNRREE